MKWLALMIFGILTFPAMGQKLPANPLENRRGAGSGTGESPGQPYIARTPYTLEWHIDHNYKLWKNDTVKAKSYAAGVHVYDEAGKIIASDTIGEGKFSGSISVPRGGTHRVRVFSTAPWHANIIEDKEFLKRAIAEGRLGPDGKLKEKKVEDGNPVPKPASAREDSFANFTAQRAASIEIIKINRKVADLNERDRLVAIVRSIERQSSSVDDFYRKLDQVSLEARESPESSATNKSNSLLPPGMTPVKKPTEPVPIK